MRRFKRLISFLMMLSALIVSEKGCVILVYISAAGIHELGHIFAAKILKIKIKEISFDYSGLRIYIDEAMTPYSLEMALAAAGPIFNFIAAFSVALICKGNGRELKDIFQAAEMFITRGEPDLTAMCGFFIMSSCIQAFINLLPIKSFDGGRILYCFMANLCNESVADSILTVTSGIFAFILWTISLYLMLKISSGVGVYIFSMCIFAIILKDVPLMVNE